MRPAQIILLSNFSSSRSQVIFQILDLLYLLLLYNFHIFNLITQILNLFHLGLERVLLDNLLLQKFGSLISFSLSFFDSFVGCLAVVLVGLNFLF
jgi:hypothetical protein